MGRQPVCICIHRVWNYYLGVVNGTQQCPRAREAEAESRAALQAARLSPAPDPVTRGPRACHARTHSRWLACW